MMTTLLAASVLLTSAVSAEVPNSGALWNEGARQMNALVSGPPQIVVLKPGTNVVFQSPQGPVTVRCLLRPAPPPAGKVIDLVPGFQTAPLATNGGLVTVQCPKTATAGPAPAPPDAMGDASLFEAGLRGVGRCVISDARGRGLACPFYVKVRLPMGGSTGYPQGTGCADDGGEAVGALRAALAQGVCQ